MTPERTGSAASSKRPGLILMALLAWGALAFGAVYPWAYWPLAVGCALLGLWAMLERVPWRDPRTVALGMALGVVALAMAVQLVPLPAKALEWVSPGTVPYFERFQVGYQRPAFLALSIAPASTAVALGLFVAFALLLLGLGRALRSVPLDWLMTVWAIW